MGEEDGLRTVECLRGRLLAERSASTNAKEAAQQIENKLIELEAQLKKEIKSRKKAEKRLKLLMKKLQSFKISNPSYDFDESDKSCSLDKSEVSISSKGQESMGDEETINSVGEDNLGGNSQISKIDYQSLISSHEDRKDNGESNEGSNDVDNSMALVPHDLPKTAEPIRDVVILDATVKEVLDSLRRVKEKIQNSKEQRKMVRVG